MEVCIQSSSLYTNTVVIVLKVKGGNKDKDPITALFILIKNTENETYLLLKLHYIIIKNNHFSSIFLKSGTYIHVLK